MKSKTSEWDSFIRRIYVDAPLEKIYQAWAKPSEIVKWFLSKAITFDDKGKARPANAPMIKGDSYKWNWYGTKYTGTGNCIAANKKDLIIFSFADDFTVVKVKLSRKKNRTLVELEQQHTHSKIADRKTIYMDCHPGWSYHMTNLKSIYEGGIDLREKKPDQKHMVNA